MCRCSCSTDYVDVYNLAPRRRSSDTPVTDLVATLDDMDATQLGHYCGMQLPGPQLSDEWSSAMRVVFISNVEGINTGFRAKYEFIAKQPVSKRTISSLISLLYTQIYVAVCVSHPDDALVLFLVACVCNFVMQLCG